jgi:CHAT domain-containing protein
VEKGDLETQVNDLNQALVRLDEHRGSQLSAQLYKKLFEPIESLIDKGRLTIIPDGVLFFLNFEILQKEDKGKPFELGSLLIHDYIISYQLSATVALQFKQMESSGEEGILTFAPGFSDQQKQNYLASVQDTTVLDKKYLNFIQQPFAVKSAMQIASLFSGFAYVGDEANETRFKEEAARYGIIHLGTHAEINQSVPLMSNLVLSKNVNSDSLDDGYLHAYEIYQMPLRAELAVLTACETGLGRERSSEGVISLAHSFAYAGCPAIVMSLWRIDEKTSSMVINSFYDYLEKGLSKDMALHQAKLDFIANARGQLQLPYYWAGMVLLGDPDPVVLKKSGHGYLLWTILSVLILTLIIFFIYRRKTQ